MFAEVPEVTRPTFLHLVEQTEPETEPTLPMTMNRVVASLQIVLAARRAARSEALACRV